MSRRVYSAAPGALPGQTGATRARSPGTPKRLADEYYAERAKESEGLGKRAVARLMGRSVSPEVLLNACYALWCVEKEFTHLETSIALGCTKNFVSRVVDGATCRDATPKPPPDSVINALFALSK